MSLSSILEGLPGAAGELEDFYRDLHQHPELSMREERTTAVISSRLKSLGIEVEHVGGGVVGLVRNGTGPTVLMRADIDALPVREETGLPYASTASTTTDSGGTVPVMHACGHDVHATALIGATELLCASKDHWSGTAICLFQPGEEIAAGARAMVADGLVDRVPRPDVALGQHVLGVIPAGTVATCAGPVMSSAASVRISVYGKGSHGSMPHLGVDPVVVASSLVLRLQTIVSREVAPSDFAVLTVGSVQAGSSANVIPETATLLVNIRAYDEAVRHRLLEAIGRIARAESQASCCPAPPLLEIYDSYPATSNDSQVTERVTRSMQEALGEPRVLQLPPQTASEDFSIIPDAFEIPYTYWGLGGFTEDQETFPNHSPRFGPALQPTLATGVTAMTAATFSYLGT